MFSVMCGSELFLVMVVGCSCFVVFIFYNRTFILYLFYLFLKGFFHLGGLDLKCTSAFNMLFTEWQCFCFFHLLNTILGL